MSRKEKILLKFLSSPKDFTYSELTQLLSSFNYSEVSSGKTSGSRVVFFNEEIQHIIRLHKPHPSNNLKTYQINLIIEELKKKGIIK